MIDVVCLGVRWDNRLVHQAGTQFQRQKSAEVYEYINLFHPLQARLIILVRVAGTVKTHDQY